MSPGIGHLESAMEESINSARAGSENNGASPSESVADILERQLDDVIEEWLVRVEKEPDLTCIALTFQERTGHLPQLLRDVIWRWRVGEGERTAVSVTWDH